MTLLITCCTNPASKNLRWSEWTHQTHYLIMQYQLLYIPLNIKPKHTPLLSRGNFTSAPAFRLVPSLNRWLHNYIIKKFISHNGMISFSYASFHFVEPFIKSTCLSVASFLHVHDIGVIFFIDPHKKTLFLL